MTKVLVTGSSDGIGKATAAELARQGAQVIVHGRTPARAAEAARDIPGAETWVCDFDSLDQVREAAARAPDGLDVLINNAGIYARERRTTRDSYELTFQVNHLAPFLLTNLLLPKLRQGARIINVSSQLHASGAVHWNDLMLERDYSGSRAYGQSKLANVLFTRELARRFPQFTANALHPGVVGTKLLRGGFGSLAGASTDRGAETSVYLATSPEVAGVTGKYFVDRREIEPAGRAQDDEAAQRLWAVSAQLCRM